MPARERLFDMCRECLFNMRPCGGRLRRRLAAAVVAATTYLVLAAFGSAAVQADVGYRDGSTSGTHSPTGTKRPESAMWINDGYWWTNMWDPVSDDYHIFRLSPSSPQTWTDTGVTIDTRSGTSADTLWDGTHLYVSSHNQADTAAAGYPAFLYRFSYNPVTRLYSLDSGYPTQINNYKTETLVIAKDSTGTVWATWMQGGKIYVNHTVAGDRTWGTPFVLPVAGSTVSGDDISSVVAFGGGKIGVIWGNQTSSSDGFYFAVHQDGQPDTNWTLETAWKGTSVADDHINIKADAAGRLYAAVKTSFTSSSQPLTALLVRDTSGTWSHYAVDTVADCPNRPTVVIDSTAGVAHVFETGPAAPTFSCNSDGGDIYEKTAPLSTLAFGSGRGTVVLRDDDNHQMHNNTSTKQIVGPMTGLVALAVERSTNFYWHHWDPLGAIVPGAPVADFSGSPTSGAAPLTVAFRDQSTGSPTSWSWSFGDGGTSTAQNPSHVYSAPGSYDVTLIATNAYGSSTKTKADYVTVTVTGSTPQTFTPVADARVSKTQPTTNFGDHTTLRLKQSSTTSYESYAKFTVSGLTGGVASAKLRMYVTDPSVAGGSIYLVGSDWTESGITWNARPPISGTAIATAGATTKGTWVEWDVTGTVTNNGTYSFGMRNGNSDGAYYSSKEGGHPPQLVITPG
jgi:PKD repeat protein